MCQSAFIFVLLLSLVNFFFHFFRIGYSRGGSRKKRRERVVNEIKKVGENRLKKIIHDKSAEG
jgi:hypothetical protein